LDTQGQHLLVEYHGCDTATLNDERAISHALERAAIEAGATIVTKTFHRFAPQGVSGVVVIEESHLSIHTWPENGYAAVDFYTCGDCEPERANRVLRSALCASRSEVLIVRRGQASPQTGTSLKIHRHYSEGKPEGHDGLVHRNL
jgi:S-adenosylmethionine decarboxylase proenzyme